MTTTATAALTAALYARVSTEKQDADDKTSLSEQIGDMEAYCERKGLTIAARFQEVGSGTTRNRPEFQRMLADAKAGRFDTIVCWKSDRLSRGMYPAAALMEVVEAHQIRLEAVMDAIDMKTFGLMAAIGKIELDNFRERASMGKRGAAKQGRIPSGSIPYGYRIGDDGKPEIVEPEAEVVRRIFTAYLEGTPATAIVVELEESTGRRWHEAHVHRMLGQTAYAGRFVYGRSKKTRLEDGTVVKREAEGEPITIAFPVLISEEDFAEVAALKAERRRFSKRSEKTFYLLSKLLRCDECGLLVGGFHRVGGIRYYRCYGSKRQGSKCRPRPYVNADALEKLVWDEVVECLTDPDSFYQAVDSDDGDDSLTADIDAAERDLGKVQGESARLLRVYVSGLINEDELTHQRKFITERLESAKERVEGLRIQQAANEERAGVANTVTAWAARIGEGLDDLDDDGRREVLRLVLESGTIDRNNSVRLHFVLASQPPRRPEDFRVAGTQRLRAEADQVFLHSRTAVGVSVPAPTPRRGHHSDDARVQRHRSGDALAGQDRHRRAYRDRFR